MPLISSSLLSWVLAVSVAAPAIPPAAIPARGGAPVPLAAPPPGAPSSPTFDRAVEKYMAGQILEAIDDYQHLFVTTGEPVCLANIGRLYTERGDLELAAEYYRKFLVHPRAVPAQKVDVRERLLAIAPHQPEPMASPPSAPAPVPAPVPVPEGPRPAEALAIDRTPQVMIGIGGTLLAAAVPMVVVGGVLAWRTAGLRMELVADDVDAAEQRAVTADEATSKQIVAISLLVCGGAALVAGITMLGLGGRRARLSRRIAAGAGGLTIAF